MPRQHNLGGVLVRGGPRRLGVFSPGGTPTPSPTPTATAPTLTRTSTTGTNPMSWSAAYADIIVGSDYISCRWRVNGGAWTNETDHLFTSDDALDALDGSFSFQWPLFKAYTFPASALVEVQEGITRGGTTAWSSILSDTMAAVGPPQTAALAYRFENTLVRLKQSNAGATAVAADGDPVGYWENTGSTTRHLTAAANDTTRPTFRITGGINEVQFDGANDLLRNITDPGLYTASGYTAMICMRSTSVTTGKLMVAAGNGTTGTEFVGVVGSNGTTAANGNSNYRNTISTNFVANTVNHYTNGHPGTNKVIVVVDDGSGITWYVDGVAGTRQAYTRSGNAVSLLNLSLGGLLRSTPILWFPGYVHGLFVWPATVLSGTEIAQATTYGGTLQGRTL